MTENDRRYRTERTAMLFIQIITIKYNKTRRSGEDMRRISSVRFSPVPAEIDVIENGEIYLHDETNLPRQKEKIFPYTDNFQTGRTFVRKDGDKYLIYYSARPADQYPKKVIVLDKNEYGRVVYNDREPTFDSEWIYKRITINFVYADAADLRPKLFFRKEADFLYEDMGYLRYFGDYHLAKVPGSPRR